MVNSEHKLKSKADWGEESLKNGVDFEHIDFEWMFEVFKSMYQEPVGAPIARITKQLSELETIIYLELGVGMRTPEGFWDWAGG